MGELEQLLRPCGEQAQDRLLAYAIVRELGAALTSGHRPLLFAALSKITPRLSPIVSATYRDRYGAELREVVLARLSACDSDRAAALLNGNIAEAVAHQILTLQRAPMGHEAQAINQAHQILREHNFSDEQYAALAEVLQRRSPEWAAKVLEEQERRRLAA